MLVLQPSQGLLKICECKCAQNTRCKMSTKMYRRFFALVFPKPFLLRFTMLCRILPCRQGLSLSLSHFLYPSLAHTVFPLLSLYISVGLPPANIQEQQVSRSYRGAIEELHYSKPPAPPLYLRRQRGPNFLVRRFSDSSFVSLYILFFFISCVFIIYILSLIHI